MELDGARVARIPAILTGLYRTEDMGRSLLPFGLIAGTALAEMLAGKWMTTPYYVWTVPVWLAWYLYATHGKQTIAAA